MELRRPIYSLVLTFGIITSSYAEVVGLTPGSFRVDESGAATYSINIATPAGRAGVTPPVSLSYSSSNKSDGLVGVGWSVSGSSSISRCPPVPIHDGEIQSVLYNSEDKLCLDGRRLILVSGVYLAPGSKYRFEVDDFSEITAVGGNATDGPQYFSRINKNGETHYYGNSEAISTMFSNHDDAFVEPGGFVQGELAKSWMLKVVEDAKSNFILYNYDNVSSDGVAYLETIEYAGNLDTNENPYAKIEFIYGTHSNEFSGYYAGAPTVNERLLERIDTKVDAEVYRSYFLEYEDLNYAESRVMLTSVQECPDSDSDKSNCRKPTEFDWQRPTLSQSFYTLFDASSNITSTSPNQDTTQFFDINGDGFGDMLYVDSNAWRAKLGPVFGSSQYLTGIGDDKKEYAMNIDYNGDGVRDLLIANNETSNWHVITYLPNSSPTHCASGSTCSDFINTRSKSVVNLGVTAVGMEGEAQVMDVDGDGNEDIVYRTGGYIRAHMNDGDGTFTPNVDLYLFTNTPSGGNLNDNYVSQSGDMTAASQIDINGDGRSDLIMEVTTTTGGCKINGEFVPGINNANLCQADGGIWETTTTTNNNIYVASGSMSSPSLTFLTGYSGDIDNIRVADLNGDGLSDLLYVFNNQWYYALSNGVTLQSPKDLNLTTASDRKHLNQFVDLNGDGRADILHATSTTNWNIYFSTAGSSADEIARVSRGSYVFGNNATIRFGDTDGDGKLDMLKSTGGAWEQNTKRAGINEFVINKITNGFDVETDIEYAPMNDTNVYVMQGSDANVDATTLSPVSGASVVERVSTQTTQNDDVSVRYEYGGILFHKQGRGSLGFQMLRTIDEQSGVISETQYSQEYENDDFASIGMPIYSEQSINSQILSSAKNTYDTKTTYSFHSGATIGLYPFSSLSEEKSYLFNTNGTSTLINTTETTMTVDTWGNPKNITTKVTAAHNNHFTEIQTDNLWGGFTSAQFGRLRETEVTYNRTGDENNRKRKTTFDYYSDNLLKKSIVAPGTAKQLETTYLYDSYGNKTQTTVIGYSTNTGANQTRISITDWSTNGRFINFEENGFGEKNTYAYNGAPASTASGITTELTLTGPNALSTITDFDEFQQVEKVDYADDREATTVTAFCTETNAGCVTDAYYVVKQTVIGSPKKEAHYDKWGRVITSRVEGFDGTWNATNTTYDTQGRVFRTYEPNDATNYTEVTYDVLNRPFKVTQPNSATIEQTYNGLTSTTINALNQESVVIANGLGQTGSTEDNIGGTVTFAYNAFGNLISSTTEVVNGTSASTITNTFDDWGRKETTTDPVKGLWEYTYNAFGELYTQKTARNHTTTFEYDLLGRKVSSQEANEGTLCWEYGTPANTTQKAKGKLLTKAKYSGIVNCSSPGTPIIKKSYYYDAKGRVRKESTKIGSSVFDQLQTYDAYSRPKKTTYPTGTQTVASKINYNSYGYAFETRRFNDNYLLRSIDSMDARGNVLQTSLGNGVITNYGYDTQTGWLESIDSKKGSSTFQSVDLTFDSIGNVKTRHSLYQKSVTSDSDFTETYAYDDLNRLTDRTVNFVYGASYTPIVFQQEHEFKYDGWGNIKERDSDSGNSGTSSTKYYKYDSTIKHKLLGVYNNAGFSGTPIYDMNSTNDYDANGNILNDGNRTFTYSSFDKATQISQTGASSTMSYGVDKDLYYKQDVHQENGSSVTYERYYIGAYEMVVRTGGNGNTTEHKYNIGNAVLTYRTGSNTTSFLHKDNQGSVVATTDASGNVQTQAIYDPFGLQSVVYQDSTYLTNLPPITDRGYTGHKQMNHLGIIHMGGRIYDPTLGRFLQADPFIQAPKNSQSYNRYSYVLNNPMSYTDPSGYISIGDLNPFKTKRLLRSIAKVPILNLAAQAAACFYGGPAGCAAYSAATTYAVTGSLKAAFTAGLVSAITPMSGNYFTTALIGGLASKAQGGNFGHGFWSAGLGAALGGRINTGNAYANVAIAAVIGGTVSKMTGGKFANGAQTWAFSAAMAQDWGKSNSQHASSDGEMEGSNISDLVDADNRLGLTLSEDGSTLSGSLKIYCANVSSAACSGLAKSFENINQTVDGITLTLTMEVTSWELLSDISVRYYDFKGSGSVGGRGGDSQRVSSFLGLGPSNKIRLQNGIGYASSISSLTPAHELGHAIGLSHQYNSTNSLMSYSSNKSGNITSQQMKNLFEAYR